ncbi:chemotaxis protein CheW [Imhoffiella purpurea]|uniref:Type IV pili signal transduction protein PilI n=1 Tax=Imhoffiella purpurea TaxID=1249627 RepID=W9W063_9GAMM|nr:chemotaxis protein CheW [Imhoffiella purpurea]EXJ16025.1 type IV pili signal transduction protein PilI [Imhoffiella purpurea]
MARSERSRTDLLDMIRQLDARCRARAAGLPDETRPPDSWAAVLFKIRSRLFLTPLEQIAEVLELPWEITRVPGTKPWLLGVANNRGTLLPIYDLTTLIEGGQPPNRRRRPESGADRRREVRSRERVLVVRQDELPCGLVVSEAVGMRYVKNTDRVEGPQEDLGPSKAYVESFYLLDGAPVPVIRLIELMGDPVFSAAKV